MNQLDSRAYALPHLPGTGVLLFCSMLLLPVAGLCAENIVHTAGAITYVSGGVDDASLDSLKGVAKNYDLKLVFALKSGEFMSDVKVAISDAKGNVVVSATSDGPWFLAKLPAGSYRVVATSSTGKSITQQAVVAPAKLKALDFRWASE